MENVLVTLLTFDFHRTRYFFEFIRTRVGHHFQDQAIILAAHKPEVLWHEAAFFSFEHSRKFFNCDITCRRIYRSFGAEHFALARSLGKTLEGFIDAHSPRERNAG